MHGTAASSGPSTDDPDLCDLREGSVVYGRHLYSTLHRRLIKPCHFSVNVLETRSSGARLPFGCRLPIDPLTCDVFAQMRDQSLNATQSVDSSLFQFGGSG
jgi:hypothetical protein